MSATKILWGQILTVFLIVVLTTWAATQWTAWRLGFQPQLGAPWFELVGLEASRAPVKSAQATDRVLAGAGLRTSKRTVCYRGARASRSSRPESYGTPRVPYLWPHTSHTCGARA
ncbi:MAG: hypothetical protein E5X45_28590 [Mesorhizobium sp.]|nr:hypothetical protein EOD29_11140 [Mesorhizobium sp. M1A.T.Ca.IN.004.03.1.1]RWK25172.1 MAG: hypothetical protein EOR40_30760 [Mesorhizobium sp.]RWK88214.1 MAG: hypothetical protein EOR52_14670 [Mesorhizobium sp.]TIP17635.1 MAG: hypothetical protein E5X66_20085 [Mesorhizobium sp.]TJV77120.1 MAG: hypothetical protein E5X45_28590 [Mesorhizobium sp.]